MNKLILGIFICLAYLVPQQVLAHELLPKEVQEYIEANPNVSAQQLQSFINLQDPEIRAEFGSAQDVTDILTNRESGFVDNAQDFIKLGVEHILAGPDHILFVLSLLLVFISLREILKLTTAFTVAHSITLLLAGSGILTLSSRIVEPLIAFSIAYVALTSVFFQKYSFLGTKRGKIAAIFFFGLFHGLGFAGLLQEISIPKDKFIPSLLFFNVGIELGQLLTIALALPLIYYAKDKAWYPQLIKVIAGVIAVLGIYWGITRIMGI